MDKKVLDFSRELSPGNVKAAMKDCGAVSRDLWQVPVGNLRVIEGFNPRSRDEAYFAHVNGLADSMVSEGYYPDKPLKGFVALEDGENVIYVTEGHCRHEALPIAIKRGAQIEAVPVVVAPRGTSMEDLTVALSRSNDGKPFSPYENAVICKRLVRFGLDEETVANRLGFTEAYVKDLLLLVAAPKVIRDMVEAGKVSATTAIEALKARGDKAADFLQDSLARAQAAGKSKVTAKHTHFFAPAVKKAAPVLYDTIHEVRNDPAYASISPALREKVEALVKALDDARAKDGETAQPEKKAA